MAVIDYSRSASSARPFARAFAALFATLVTWNEARQTRKALNALTDRELEDIGLVRGDIERIAQ